MPATESQAGGHWNSKGWRRHQVIQGEIQHPREWSARAKYIVVTESKQEDEGNIPKNKCKWEFIWCVSKYWEISLCFSYSLLWSAVPSLSCVRMHYSFGFNNQLKQMWWPCQQSFHGEAVERWKPYRVETRKPPCKAEFLNPGCIWEPPGKP